MQFLELNINTGFRTWDSDWSTTGKRKGQPFRKTIVRMPGPSMDAETLDIKNDPFLFQEINIRCLVWIAHAVLLQVMLVSFDDIILDLGTQIIEQGRIPGYTDHKIAITIRVLLSVTQVVAADDAELNMQQFEVDECFYQFEKIYRSCPGLRNDEG